MGSTCVYRTVCPRNCYCTCGTLVGVRDGQIVSIEGDPLNQATRGKVCLKGISYARRISAGDRLTAPLRRRAGKGDFETVSWDEALDDITGRLKRLRSDPGPLSVLYYEGSGSHGALSVLADAFWNPFGGPTRTHGDLCWPAGLEATRLTYGANFHNHPRLTTDSRFILRQRCSQAPNKQPRERWRPGSSWIVSSSTDARFVRPLRPRLRGLKPFSGPSPIRCFRLL